MKSRSHDSPAALRRRMARVAVFSLAPLLLAGCTALRDPASMCGKRAQPSNIYGSSARLPERIRRVAVLPITVEPRSGWLECGMESLQPVLCAELSKTRKFDVVPVTPWQVGQLTDQSDWTDDQPLPADLLARVRNLTGCDAVLFTRLTRYQPYCPVAVGWKLSLVDETTGVAYWGADEIFDGGDRAVANSAQDYAWNNFQGPDSMSNPSLILSSPTRFGQYGLAALFARLPSR